MLVVLVLAAVPSLPKTVCLPELGSAQVEGVVVVVHMSVRGLGVTALGFGWEVVGERC